MPDSDRPHETSRATRSPLPEDPRDLTRCVTVEELRVFLCLEKDYVIRRGVRREDWPHLRIGQSIRFAPEHVRDIVKRFARGRPVRARRSAGVPPLAGVPGVSPRSRAAHA